MTYSGPRLEDMQDDDLDEVCMSALGDSIQYKVEGGAYAPFSAYVDYGEALRDIETGKAIEQDITVQMLKSDLAARPRGADRLTLGRLAGRTFKPVNIRSDRSGTHWEFEVVTVDA